MQSRTPGLAAQVIGSALFAFAAVSPAPVLADDWSGWMGSFRDGVYRETGIIDEVPSGGLPVKWRQPIHGGYAGPAAADGRVFVFDFEKLTGKAFNDPSARAEVAGRERLLALDAKTGRTLWQHAYDCEYSISYPAGPRCTPTVDDDRVYILGSQGDFKCLNVADGQVRWSRNLVDDFGAEVPLWGFSSHPLVDGELVYSMVGGDGQAIVAFDKMTGQVRWKALDAKAGYCPPSIVEAGGVRQLIVFHPQAVVGLNPADGEVYWDIPITPGYEMSITRPMVEGDRMYVSAIRTEAVMIELAQDRPAAKELWRGQPKNAVHCSNATPLLVDGVIYGTDCNDGDLKAVSGDDGTILWETFEPTKPGEQRYARHGTAFLTRIGESDRFLLMSESGELIIASLTEKGFQSHGRFQVLEPTGECFGRDVVWSHPAYADRTAYVRNDQEIVAVDLAK